MNIVAFAYGEWRFAELFLCCWWLSHDFNFDSMSRLTTASNFILSIVRPQSSPCSNVGPFSNNNIRGSESSTGMRSLYSYQCSFRTISIWWTSIQRLDSNFQWHCWWKTAPHLLHRPLCDWAIDMRYEKMQKIDENVSNFGERRVYFGNRTLLFTCTYQLLSNACIDQNISKLRIIAYAHTSLSCFKIHGRKS